MVADLERSTVMLIQKLTKRSLIRAFKMLKSTFGAFTVDGCSDGLLVELRPWAIRDSTVDQESGNSLSKS
jgi:hypothetical protein